MLNDAPSVNHKIFWLVWSDESGQIVGGCYDSVESARDKAQQMVAESRPESRFVVLRACEGWQTTAPTVMELAYCDPDEQEIGQ